MDGALACALPFLAWRALVSDKLHKSVVLFVAFGLLAAVAWARMDAPDVALVEAAVGAGLTGALLMSALGWVDAEPSPRASAIPRVALLLLLIGVAAGLGLVMLDLAARGHGLRDVVLARMQESGVSHPVTAVLLNFRGYDTLLEIAVLLAAAMGVATPARHGDDAGREESIDRLLSVLTRLLIPGVVLVAGHLLWRGSAAPGGAFQSGAVLGGAGILLILSRTIRPLDPSSGWVRAGLLVGPAVFLTVAAAPLVAGRSMLEYPRQWAGMLIFAIETSLSVSIAVTLTMFFSGAARTGAPLDAPPGGRLP
jgi:multisubunit Na+/H+ antiporter MnhB subunit